MYLGWPYMLPFFKTTPLPKLPQQAFLGIRGLRISYLPNYLSYPSYLFSCLPSFLPRFLPSFLPRFLPSFLPSFPPNFLPNCLMDVEPQKNLGLGFFPITSCPSKKRQAKNDQLQNGQAQNGQLQNAQAKSSRAKNSQLQNSQAKNSRAQKNQAKNTCLSTFFPRLFALNILIFFLCLPCIGCGSILPVTPVDVVPTVAHMGYATVQDQRDMEDMVSDKDLALRLKQELMHVRVKDGYFLNVHVFNGQVFLVGDPPQDFQEAAVRFAMQQEGVVSLDYCFFPHNSGNAFNDFLVSVSLRSNLVFEQGISSTWVETEVYASTAILLGVVPDNDAIEHIKAVAWNTQGVNNVISFLLLDNSS